MCSLANKTFILNQGEEISNDTRICRYMDFDYFLCLLSGKFYVPRKLKFLDERERGVMPWEKKFIPGIVGGDFHDAQKFVGSEQVGWDSYLECLKQSKYLLTSCWAKDEGESYLMWKSYTSRIGVCVHTTIGDFIKGLDVESENYIPICSLVYYRNQDFVKNYLLDIYRKDPYYLSEREIRFYFVKKKSQIHKADNTEVQMLLINSAVEEEQEFQDNPDCYKMDRSFNFDPSYIRQITLSPFISEASIMEIRRILMAQYRTVLSASVSIKKSCIYSKN